MNNPRKQRLKDAGNPNQEQLIYERIFDAILEQKLIPGARLTEEVLGEIFSVSRTVVRRVLLRLSHEGVVELKPNKGASVIRTSVEEVYQFFTARKIIESAIMKMAVGKATQYQLESLRSLVTEEQRHFDSGSRGRGLRTSSEFHLRIADVAGNKPMAEMARQLISRTSLIVSQYQAASRPPCAHCDHGKLVETLENGTPEQGAAMMEEHIHYILDCLRLEDEDTEPDLFEIFSSDTPTDE